MPNISVETIHQHIQYGEALEGYDGIVGFNIMWDYENKEIDDIMENEYLVARRGRKLNLMWIEEIKMRSDWKLGEKIYIETNCNSDGNFYCWFSKNKQHNCYDFEVEKNGSVSVFGFRNGFKFLIE